MTDQPSLPESHSLTDYVEDGAHIAAILLVWTVIAAFFTFGVSEIGGPGSLFETIGPGLGSVFALTGLLNAILFVVYRAIDYHKA